MNGSAAGSSQDAWSRLNKWAESLKPPAGQIHKGYRDRRLADDGGGSKGSNSRGSNGSRGLAKSARPAQGLCTIKGTVKGYLRPTVVIEKHSD